MILIDSSDLRRARIALAVSLAIAAILGAVGLMTYWNWRGCPDLGKLRAIAFAFAMVALHAIGYRAYRDQVEFPQFARRLGFRLRKVSNLILFAFALQLGLVLISSIMLDGGMLLGVTCMAAAGYWGAAITIICHKSQLTRDDFLFLKWGQLPLMGITILTAILMACVGRW